MPTSPGSHHILVAKHYGQAFFRCFASLLNEQMSKVKVLAKEKNLALDRVHPSMQADLPRIDYFANGRRISVSNSIPLSASNLGRELKENKCFWATKYLEELSSILHQGIIKTIYDAKKLCKHSSWHPDLNLNLDVLTHAAYGAVLFCIYPEANDNGFRLFALPIMVESSGYSMKLNLEGIVG